MRNTRTRLRSRGNRAVFRGRLNLSQQRRIWLDRCPTCRRPAGPEPMPRYSTATRSRGESPRRSLERRSPLEPILLLTIAALLLRHDSPPHVDRRCALLLKTCNRQQRSRRIEGKTRKRKARALSVALHVYRSQAEVLADAAIQREEHEKRHHEAPPPRRADLPRAARRESNLCAQTRLSALQARRDTPDDRV